MSQILNSAWTKNRGIFAICILLAFWGMSMGVSVTVNGQVAGEVAEEVAEKPVEKVKPEIGVKIMLPLKEEEHRYHDPNLGRCLSKALRGKYVSSKKGLIEIQPYLNEIDEKLIEGMETITAVRVEMGYIITNTLFDTEVSWKAKESMGKADNKTAALQNATTKFCKDKEQKTDLIQFIDDFIESTLNENCQKTVSIIRELMKKDDYDAAFLAFNYIPAKSECGDSKEGLEQELLKAQQKHACETILQETRIKAMSPQPWQVLEAIDQLLEIPPGSDCAEEAIEVAQIIGENNKIGVKQNQEKLDQYILILNENRQSEWLSQHRSQLYIERNTIDKRKK